ncbi:unnamed protein product, partial [Closterium sp. NIES-53]
PEEETTPIPTTSAIPNAARIFLLSSVCRRWRALAKRDVSTFLVERNRVISLHEVSHAVARFPNLAHLHLCDGSVETLDDAFLAHLASSCPKLTILHVGSGITQHPDYVGLEHQHPITEAGLDRFFQQCTQLEQLSLLCLHRDVELPPSFFHLTRLHTLALTAASALESPDLDSLGSLTTLHIASTGTLNNSQICGVFPALPAFPPPSGPAFLLRLPDDIAELLPCLGELTICRCDLFQELTICRCDLFQELTICRCDLFQELTICRCDLFQQLPEGFTSLNHLQTLSLFKCRQLRCLPENFGRLSALKTLVMEQLPLPSLPDSRCQLSALETFFLLWSKLVLRPGVSKLVQANPQAASGRVLREGASRGRGRAEQPAGVTAFCPHLKALPASLTCLSRLEALTLFSCRRLASAPTRLDDLTRLKQLVVTSRDMLKHPPQLLPASLETLSWGSYRHSMALPDTGTALPQLRRLELKFAGRLRELPASITALQNLTCLEIDSAPQLASLPHGIGALSRLRQLRLVLCDQLEHLPASLTRLTCLNELAIPHSSIRYLCSNFARLTRLKSLCLTGCVKLQVLPGELSELKAVQRLDVQECGHVMDSDGSVLPRSINQMYGLKLHK